MPYGRRTNWDVLFTREAEQWYMRLGADDAARIAAAFDQLEQRGPVLGRPFVDSIKGSRHRNMKELRSVGGHLRALFAFDPRRRAIVLLGGDKANDWKGWYVRNIPRADKLYDKRLKTLGSEATWETGKPRPGGRSADSGR
jgi:hypothetical protein